MIKKTTITKTPRPLFAFCIMVLALSIIHLEYLVYVLKTNTKPDTEFLEVEVVHPKAAENPAEKVESSNEQPTPTVEAIVTEAPKQSNLVAIKDADNYLLHIKTFSALVSKFLSNVDYAQELSLFQSTNNPYPSKIAESLNELKLYRDKYLVSKNEKYNKVKLRGSFVKRMLNKVVEVKEENPTYASMEEEHNKIAPKIANLEQYFYSKEFLKRYLSND